jgi:hypothetical protein
VYEEFERAWLCRQVDIVDFIPLLGLVSSEREILFGDGFVLRPMTDAEMNASLLALAVLIESPSMPVNVTVSRYNQCALTHTQPAMLVSGLRSATPTVAGPAAEEMVAAGHRLVTALRLAVGGSVQASRPIRHFANSPLDPPGGHVINTAVALNDPQRACVVHGEHLDALRFAWNHLDSAIASDRTLEIALGRLVFAGGRLDAVNRLFDLMIAAEALLESTRTSSKKQRTGVRIGIMVNNTPGASMALGATADQILAFCDAAYKARNDAMHSNWPTSQAFIGLAGDIRQEATVVDDVIRFVASGVIRARRELFAPA